MKLLAILIVKMLFAFILSSKPNYKFKPVFKNCPLLLPVENYSETVFLDMDSHAHPEFKTCILQKSLFKKPVLLVNADVDIQEKVTGDLFRSTNYPNVIIVTNSFTTKLFGSALWRFFMRSNWSFLYIVVTDGSKFKCKNGEINPNDFLLLENIMNTMWHRFQIMRVGVIFPFACEQRMVIYNGTRPSNRKLYDRSIKLINATNAEDLFVSIKKSSENLHINYPIQGSMFYRYPTAIKDCENLHFYVNFNLNLTDGYCGVDGMVMHDILSYFKFNNTFNKDEKCDYYGYGVSGNLSGTLGCISRKELDISFNSRFMTLYLNEEVYYMTYVKTDTLCALIRKPGVIPIWQGVFDLFSLSLWALIGAVLVAIAGFMWAAAMINKSMTSSEAMPLWRYLHMSMIATMIGYSPTKTRTLLMMRSACLLGSIFILGIYQGHINRVYTTVERFQQIKTLKDLYSSGATLYTSPSMYNILRQIQNPEDKLQEAFFNRTQLIEGDRDRLGVVLQHKSAATVDRKADAVMEILEQYSDNHGTPLIDIVDECFYTYYLSCITRAGFPFFEELQVFTERLNEAGLPNIYYKWTQQMLEIPKLKGGNNSEPRTFTKINLKDIAVAFGILFVGTIISAIVFVGEMWMARGNYFKQFKLYSYKRRS